MLIPKDKLQKLLDEGKKFDFYSACNYNGVNAYTTDKSEYASWKIRVETILISFGKDSPVYRLFKSGQEIKFGFYDYRDFNSAKDYMLGALHAAIEMDDSNLNVNQNKKINDSIMSKKIFVVHGHDESLKQEVEIFLREIGLEPIVLHRQPDQGQTLIEKFEKNSDVGYAIILLTPDDIGYSKEADKKDNEIKKKYRARQNVIFEFGYFVGKLGRERVCCIHKKELELPTDINGLLYKGVKENLGEVKYELQKELKSAGYSIK